MPITVTVTCTPTDNALKGMRELCANIKHLDVDQLTPITMTKPLTVTSEDEDHTLNGGAVPLGALLDYIDSFHNVDENTPVNGAETLTVPIPVHVVEFIDCGEHIPNENETPLGGLYINTSTTCIREHRDLMNSI